MIRRSSRRINSWLHRGKEVVTAWRGSPAHSNDDACYHLAYQGLNGLPPQQSSCTLVLQDDRVVCICELGAPNQPVNAPVLGSHHFPIS